MHAHILQLMSGNWHRLCWVLLFVLVVLGAQRLAAQGQNPPRLSLGGDTTLCGGQIVPVQINGGTGAVQWFRDGVALSGGTATSLNITQTGRYHATVGSSFTDTLLVRFTPLDTTTFYVDRCFTAGNGGLFGSPSYFAWYPDSLDLRAPFDFHFRVRFSSLLDTPVDGIAFVLQTTGTTQAAGIPGPGYRRINPSVAIELDMFNNSQADINCNHIALHLNGDPDVATVAPVGLGACRQLDNTYRNFRVRWDPISRTLEAFYNDTLRITYTRNLVDEVFNGQANVIVGITGGQLGFLADANYCVGRHEVGCTECEDYVIPVTSDRTTICAGTSATLRAEPGHAHYSWSNGDTTQAITVNQAGTFTVTVSDDFGCTRVSAPFVLTQSNTLAAQFQSTYANCKGQIRLSATGGIRPFRFLLDGVLLADTFVTNLTTGIDYELIVIDSLGCSDTITLSIPNPSAPSLTARAFTEGCAGMVEGVVQGGVGSLSYTLTGSTTWVNGTGRFANVPAGIYMLSVRDSNGCADSVRVYVPRPQPSISVANPQGYFWYFGANAAIDFNSGAAVSITNGQLVTNEGSASIADSEGNLLFYTDGVSVWNRNHTVMPAGAATLGGNTSATQSAVIVPDPASSIRYYIFTVGATPIIPTTLSYSVVDMSLDGGLGDVTTLNQVLNTNVTEKITAVPHTNGTDYWLISHEWENNNFVAYPVTRTGVGTTPVVSAVGVVHGGDETNAIGYLKASTDGTRIASALAFDGIAQVFDFNASTGQVSNPITLTPPGNRAYGVEFSPSGNKLYISQNLANSRNIYQYDLTSTDADASEVLIATPADIPGALQLAPDGKIYIAMYNRSALSVIHHPDSTGAAADFREVGFPLTTGRSRLGLPNIIPAFFARRPAVQMTPIGDTLICPLGRLTLTALYDTCTAFNFQWLRNGQPISGATITTYQTLTAGVYRLRGITGVDTVYSDSLNITVSDLVASITGTQPTCTGNHNGSLRSDVSGGTTPYAYVWSNGSLTQHLENLGSGVYTLTVTDASGCSIVASFGLQQPVPFDLQTSITPLSCEGNGSDAAITLDPTGGTPPYSVLWDDNTNTFRRENLSAGSYTLTLTDQSGCSLVQTLTIDTLRAVPVELEALVAPSCNGGNNGLIRVIYGCPQPYRYRWNTGDTTRQISNLRAGTYTVTVSTGQGCAAVSSFTLEEPRRLALRLSSANISLVGANDGQITAHVTGGSFPFLISIGGSFTADTTYTNLAPGKYLIQVQDAAGCTVQDSVTLTQPPCILSFTASQTPATCNGCTDGRITVTTVLDGTAPYMYAIEGRGGFGTSSILLGLRAGTYTVRVRDAVGCIAEGTTTVTEPLPCIPPPNGRIDSLGRNSVRFRWSAAPLVVGYQVYYRRQGAARWIVIDVPNVTSFTLNNLTQDADYEARLITRCAERQFSAFGPVMRFRTGLAVPCRAPVGFRSDSTTTTTAALSWSALPGLPQYELQYRLNTETTWRTVTVSGTGTTLTALVPNNRYRARLRSLCPTGGTNGGSAWSAIINFSTRQ